MVDRINDRINDLFSDSSISDRFFSRDRHRDMLSSDWFDREQPDDVMMGGRRGQGTWRHHDITPTSPLPSRTHLPNSQFEKGLHRYTFNL